MLPAKVSRQCREIWQAMVSVALVQASAASRVLVRTSSESAFSNQPLRTAAVSQAALHDCTALQLPENKDIEKNTLF
ncbi:MAG: hypothetical protein AAF441_12755 [Pseudomonadota bacterium]